MIPAVSLERKNKMNCQYIRSHHYPSWNYRFLSTSWFEKQSHEDGSYCCWPNITIIIDQVWSWPNSVIDVSHHSCPFIYIQLSTVNPWLAAKWARGKLSLVSRKPVTTCFLPTSVGGKLSNLAMAIQLLSVFLPTSAFSLPICQGQIKFYFSSKPELIPTDNHRATVM